MLLPVVRIQWLEMSAFHLLIRRATDLSLLVSLTIWDVIFIRHAYLGNYDTVHLVELLSRHVHYGVSVEEILEA